MPRLDDKRQEAFCVHYVQQGVGSQAAIMAGYSEKTARQQASRLLTQDHIRARVQELTLGVDEVTPGDLADGRRSVYDSLTAIIASSNSDQARVQAARIKADLLGMGDAGTRYHAAMAKIQLDHRRLDLQQRALDLAKDDKNVRISLDFKTGKIYTAEVDEKAPSSGEKDISS